MIGIYDDKIVPYLKENLFCEPKIRTKNIVVRCPWCDSDPVSHQNLWISTEAPIFKCFGGGCNKKGLLAKLLTKISGNDISAKFVDQEAYKKLVKENQVITRNKPAEVKKLYLPIIDENKFLLKVNFIRKRLKYHNVPLQQLNGLIFDIQDFVKQNNIVLSDKVNNIIDYFQNNFVGFLSKHKSLMILRNIDPSSTFKHFKMDLQKTKYLDYYQINSVNKNSNEIVASEGIFDILTEHIFDTTGIKQDVRLYASSFSTSYNELFKSIAFHEQIFRMKVHILSDRDVHINFYKKIKRENEHLLESMIVYYNKNGKDFNDTPCIPVKFII